MQQRHRVVGAAIGRGCQWSALRSVMQMRYRYRIEPTSVQQAGLGRVFGCCRVVFNDALRVRDAGLPGRGEDLSIARFSVG